MDMNKNRGLIIAGFVVMQVMLLAAIFSLGIYVGRYGLTRDGLSYTGGPVGQPVPGNAQGAPQGAPGANQPGPVQPDANQGAGNPVPLPPGLDQPPDVVGRLVSISPDGLELATPQGRVSVLVDPRTTYRDAAGNTLILDNLEVGMILAIIGELDADGRNLVAAQVVVMPRPADQGGQGQQP